MHRSLGMLLLLAACNGDTTLVKEERVLTTSPDLLDLGTVVVGDTATATVDLTHVQGPEIQVVTVTVLNVAGEWFSADESYLPTVAIAGTDAITVTYAPQDEGYHRARLTIVTDEEDEPEHVIEVRGASAFPAADVFPTLLDFGPVEAGATAVRTVRLRNSGAVRLDLVSLAFDNGRFGSTQVPVEVDPGDELEIPVSFSPQDLLAETGTLTLDLGSAPGRTVELRGNDCANGEAALYDVDGDGYTSCGGDCDDAQVAAYPGADEGCDTVDNDCDGLIDEGTDCVDDDGDGYTELDGDCNDAESATNPGAAEDNTDGIDNDCDGVTDLGNVDLDGDGYADLAGDCDDGDTTVYPGAPERADGLDNDCDGLTDEGTDDYDDDGDGSTENGGDCDDADPAVAPGRAEQADGVDNDCDGTVDEGTVDYDDDGDGFTETGGDCNDASAAISPAQVEAAGDGVDNDCDGSAQ